MEKATPQHQNFLKLLHVFKTKENVTPHLEENYFQKQNRNFNEKIDSHIQQGLFEPLVDFVKGGIKLDEKQIRNVMAFNHKQDNNYEALLVSHRKDIQNIILKDLKKLNDRIEQYKNLTPPQKTKIWQNGQEINSEVVKNAKNSFNTLQNHFNALFNQKEPDKIVELHQLMNFHDETNYKFLYCRSPGRDSDKDILNKINCLYENLDKLEMIKFGSEEKNSVGAKGLIKPALSDNIVIYSLNTLPTHAKILINELRETFTELNLHHKIFNISQALLLENMQNKRLPQVLQEYLSIPEKYLKELNESSEKPDVLLVSSLNEIKQNISLLIDVVKDTSVDKMKKTNIYLKSI